MADNTIIRVPQPRFGIREVVYFKESALLGYLEPAKVADVFYDSKLGRTFYIFEYKKSNPSTQIAGDAIDLKSSKRISVVEEELLTYQEALFIKFKSLKSELTKTKSQLDDNFDSSSIDIVGLNGTEPLFDFNDVSVGSLITKSYKIFNSGGSGLVLSGSPPILLFGDTDDFTIAVQPGSVIPANGDDNFTVRFSPTNVGRRVAVVLIINNDPTSPMLSFTIEGNGV